MGKTDRKASSVRLDPIDFVAVGDEKCITLHRQPTAGEIKFGYGATHYRDFPLRVMRRNDGTYKRYIVAPDDGLRYYR